MNNDSSPEYLPSGASLSILEECASTSATARQYLDTKPHLPHWILARRQTAGYGRRARGWVMQEGDFAGSLVFAPKPELGPAGEYSFIAALAVFGALETLLNDQGKSADQLSLKWPNDILCDGAKLCGILLELVGTQKNPALIMGIGINVVSHPADNPYPATSLKALGINPTIEMLVREIDHHFHMWVDLWTERGFATVRDVWCEHAKGIGTTITVNLPDQQLTGRFDGIDDDGKLQLSTEEGLKKITAGDIFFRP